MRVDRTYHRKNPGKKIGESEPRGDKNDGAIEPIRGWLGRSEGPFRIGDEMVARYASARYIVASETP